MILAAQNKHQDVVEILLKHGADVTVVNNVSVYMTNTSIKISICWELTLLQSIVTINLTKKKKKYILYSINNIQRKHPTRIDSSPNNLINEEESKINE